MKIKLISGIALSLFITTEVLAANTYGETRSNRNSAIMAPSDTDIKLLEAAKNKMDKVEEKATQIKNKAKKIIKK